MEFHKIANIFPLFSDGQLLSLSEDIKRNGLKDDISLYEGRILDGRNRYLACIKAEVEPEYREFVGDYLEAVGFVWSKNLHRRHLDSSQAAMAEVKRARMVEEYAAKVERIKEEARERQDQTTRLNRDDKGRLAPVSQLIAEQVEPDSDPNTRRTDAIRAKAAGTNRSYLREAEKIVAEHPEHVEAIEQGKKTISQVTREIKKAEVTQKLIELPSEKYRVVYADPPWNYGNSGPGIDQYGPAERHYPSMTIAELCAMDIKSIVEPDAVLFLWVTSPLLDECWPVIKSWGFTYKSSFIWDKVKHNFGHYNSVRHEFLLICTRGSCTPDEKKLFDSVVAEERTEHSRKPETFRTMIDTLYPHGKRIELFSRGTPISGWDSWGNE